MLELNAQETRFFWGALVGVFLGILAFIYARVIATFNFGPSVFSPKGYGEKTIKLYTIYARVIAAIIVLFSIFEILKLTKVMH